MATTIYTRVSRAQEIFGVHRATIYRWASTGKIKIYKRGRCSFLKNAEMEELIEGGE